MTGTLWFALGFLCGIFIAIGVKVFRHRKMSTDGNLRIDSSDPDGPYMFLEISNAIDTVTSKDRVVLDVINKDYPRK